ncbi:MAG: sigma 54-interacting transcriptional regulator [Balneolaceae bacterium]|jgi:DNA-binding NtrC family response regulator
MMTATSPHIKIRDPQLDDLEGTSESLLMQDILYKILRIAKLNSNVFIVGEIGSGKKRLAHLIHRKSNRAHNPFHSFYCIDIDEHEYKNAFWGQLTFEEEYLTLKYDALEKARAGILYLDQFSELSEFYMLKIVDSYLKGCTQLFRYNKKETPRLILSFNQESYQDLVNTKTWSSLLDQLNPVVIILPPLRERKEDIPLLIDYFLNEIKENYKEYKDLKISAKALYECFNYSWPGNIRQLKNALLQGAILSYGKTIECRHLPFSMSWQLPYELDSKKMSK